MTKVSFRIYLTANILVAKVILFIDRPMTTAIGACAMAFTVSMLFSIPAGFALYYAFKLIGFATQNTWQRWILYHVLLFFIAFLPYLVVSGFLAGELGNNELLIVLYLSEGSAFLASLINSVAIHRIFKNSSHENS